MKLTIILILILNIHAPCLYGQNDGPQYTWESLSLKGNVRSITTVAYSIRFGIDKKIRESELYAFRSVFYRNGFIDSNFSRYNSSNNTFDFDYHFYWKKDTFMSTIHKVNARSKALFNKDRQLVYHYFFYEKAVTPTSEGWNFYDHEKKIITNKGKRDGLFIQTDFNYKKNTDGTYTVTSSTQLNNGYYQIDKYLRKIKKVSFSNGGAEKEVAKYQYDSLGNMVVEETISYIKDKQVGKIYKTEYKYSYDSQKNWIEKKTFKEGEPYQIEKRAIEYW